MTERYNETYNNPNSYLYIVQCEKYTKIGYTSGSVRDRITGIKSSNPFPLHLLCVFEFEDVKGVRFAERKIHEIFDVCRIHGEWFLLIHAQIDTIKKSFKDNLVKDFDYPKKC